MCTQSLDAAWLQDIQKLKALASRSNKLNPMLSEQPEDEDTSESLPLNKLVGQMQLVGLFVFLSISSLGCHIISVEMEQNNEWL